MTSSPGSTAASMAAIIASVAPQDTVTSDSGSTWRFHAADCLRAIAARSCGAPQVVAYWLYPSRSPRTAASRIRGSVSKSGNPCAKFTARSGPLSCRLRRVISRMTDSVKLWAFSDSRRTRLMSRIGTLQVEVGARTRIAAGRPFQAALPPAAHFARPAGLGEEIEHVRTAQQADHLPAADHRHAANPLADQQARRLVDPGVLGHRDHVRTHDVPGHLALLAEDIGLGHDADHVPLARDHGRARDVLGKERAGDLVQRSVLAKGDHVSSHHLLDRDHQCASSVATVSRLALPPLMINPLRPVGRFPDR